MYRRRDEERGKEEEEGKEMELEGGEEEVSRRRMGQGEEDFICHILKREAILNG